MKAVRVVCSIVATVVLFAGTAAAASPGANPGQAPGEQQAAEKREREKIRVETESNIIRLKSCIAGNPGCVANDVPRLLLRLTRPEVDAILGPAQYRLRVAADDLYYWTVPFEARGTRGLIRLRITFGDCNYREKNSRKKAVCEAELH